MMKPFDRYWRIMKVKYAAVYILLVGIITITIIILPSLYTEACHYYNHKTNEAYFVIAGFVFAVIGLGTALFAIGRSVANHLCVIYLIVYADTNIFKNKILLLSESSVIKVYLLLRKNNNNENKMSIAIDALYKKELFDEDEMHNNTFICFDYEVYNLSHNAQVIVTRKLILLRYNGSIVEDDILHLDRINEFKMKKIENSGLLASMKDMTKIVITYKNTKKKWTLYSKDEEFLAMLEQTGKCVR